MGDTNHEHDAEADAVDTDEATDTVDETEDEADTSSESENTDANDDDDDSAGADDDSSEDGNDDDSTGDSDESTDNADDSDSEDEDDGAEPELRKPKAGASNAEWAAWRAQEKEKAAKKSDDQNSDADSDTGDSDADADDDAGSNEVAKEVAKQLEPFHKQQAEQEVEASIATFLKDNPDFAPYASKVKRFANHPSRASVPIKSIFYEVAGDKLLKIGAQRAKAADEKAKKTKTGGGNATTDGKGSKDYANMPLDDFGKELEGIKTGGSRA